MSPTRDSRGLPPSVLAVDHEPADLALLTRALQCRGFTVFPASSGREAVEVLRAHPGAITLALVDLNLPGLDGLATLRELLLVEPLLRCCLASKDLASQDKDLRLAGIACILGKPFVLEDVERSLRKLHEQALQAGSLSALPRCFR